MFLSRYLKRGGVMEYLYLVGFVIVVALGFLVSWLCDRIRLPKPVFLIAAGFLLGNFFMGSTLSLPDYFMLSVAALALILFILHISSQFKIKEIELHHMRSVRMAFLSLFLNTVILSFFIHLLFQPASYYGSLIYASILSLASHSVNSSRNRASSSLNVESLISISLSVLFVSIISDLLTLTNVSELSNYFWPEITPFLQSLFLGLGVGILAGILAMRFMRRMSTSYGTMFLIFLGVLAYILVANINGNVAIALITLGLFYANVHFRHKETLLEHSSFINMLTAVVALTVFGTVAVLHKIPFLLMAPLYLKSFFLFGLYLCIRFLSITVVYKDYKLDEKLVMALVPKTGIPEAILVMLLSPLISGMQGLWAASGLVALFIIYSNLLYWVLKTKLLNIES